MNLDFLPLILQTKSSFKNEKRALSLFLPSIYISFLLLSFGKWFGNLL